MKNPVKSLSSLAAGIFAAFCFCQAPAWADVNLPAPQTDGGKGVFTALKDRHSATKADFPLKGISDQELSNILWAATGQNRTPRGWTVPLAMGAAPYNKIYVLTDKGSFLYDWKDNKLVEQSKENIKSAISPQEIIHKAPVVLVFVTKGKVQKEYAYVTAGAMAQNVYMAAGSQGVEARFLITLKEDAVREKLKLKESEAPLNLMLLGKK